MQAGAFLIKYRWRFVAAVLVALGGAVLAWQWWEGPQVAVDQVLRRDFVQTVVATGHVESPHRIDVGAQITSTVVRIPVDEGQSVKAQEVLIELAADDLKASALQADLAAAQAQARLRQLQEVQSPVAEQSLRQARITLENAARTLARDDALFKKGFIGEAALEDSRKAVALADAQVRSAQKLRDATRNAGSDFAVAQADVDQARASASAAHARLQYSRIRAPMAGLLIGRNVEVGDVVEPGKTLMTLSPQGPTQLVVEIDEKNLRLIALGQQAQVSADAYPQQHFAAVVSYINPGINAQTGAVEVKLDVAQAPAFVRQDMTVSVDVEVAHHAASLVVPSASVHDIDSAAPWVLKLAQAHAVKQAVRIGLHSGGLAEILDGLREGDAIVAGAASGLAAGVRVRSLPTDK